MIHHNSTDPVFLKKISLRVWTLRDEIESVIEKRMNKAVDGAEPDFEKAILGLEDEYVKPASGMTGGGADILPMGDLDSGEDEMAAAIAEAEAGGADDGEAAMAAAMGGDDEQSPEDMAAEMLAGNEEGTSEGSTPTIGVESSENGFEVVQRRPDIAQEKLMLGRLLLSEIDMTTMYFFCTHNLSEGQSIVIEFVIPKRFVLTAQVTYCRPYNLKSRIISKNRLPFRVGIKFSFLKDGERTLLRQFIQSIEPDIPEPVKSPEKTNQGGGDDDFDELDDLDL